MQQSRLSKVTAQMLVIGISLAFIINFGPQAGTACSPQSGPAATADGLKISAGEFNRYYQQRLEQERSRRKDFDDATAKAEGFPTRVAQELVDQRLLAMEANSRGLRLDNGTLRKMISYWFRNAMPEEGWDQETYERIIKGNYGTSTAEWEDSVRREQAAAMIQSALGFASMPTMAQIKDRVALDRTRVRLTAVRIDRSAFEKGAAAPDEAAVTAWLADATNKSAVEAAYNEQKGRFEKPKQVRARHILAKFKTGDAASEKKAKAKIDAARAKLDAGDDFAEVAKAFSEDGSASSGGDLGFFGPGRMVKPFETAAFALKAGEVSDTVTSRFGYHIIRVDEIKEASTTTLEQASPELAKELVAKEQVGKLAQAHAKSLQTLIAGGASLSKLFNADTEGDALRAELGYENSHDLKAVSSGWVTAKQRQIKGMGLVPGLASKLLKLDGTGPCPEVYETETGYAVCTIEERETPDEEAYADEGEQLRAFMGYALRQRLTEELTAALREQHAAQIHQDGLEANPYR